MTTIQPIPLNLLIPSKANVRRTGRKDGIRELAASIATHGLRQNLNVTPDGNGRFAVVAGGRRLAALRLLAKAGTLASDHPVPCLVVMEAENAAEISLAENTMRLDMHPDDACAAFMALIDKGAAVEDVAARFGITPAMVQRRLRLARVSPALRGRFRAGDVSLEQMMAFAVTDDHAAQEAAWSELSQWNRDPSSIRAHLTRETVRCTDRLARFVGLDAYLAAGGCILRDLFDREENGSYLTARPLLLRLAGEKLAASMEQVRAEGWKWVIAEAEPDYDTRYGRIYPSAGDDDDEETASFAPEAIAQAGARLRIAHDGALEVTRGLIHPDDAESPSPSPRPEKPRNATLPATMVAELTAHRTAALRVELARQPAAALAATVHALALLLFYPAPVRGRSCLTLDAERERLARHVKACDDCPAHHAFEELARQWGDMLPEDPAMLFDWCLAQPQAVLLDLLAFVAAVSVNAVQDKHDRPENGRLAHADRLAAHLGLDMAAWWQPTVEGFYGRLPRTVLAGFTAEAGVHAAIARPTLKKLEVAQRVAKALDGSGWLPAPLRPADAA